MKTRAKADAIILIVSLILYGINRLYLKEIVRNPFISYLLKCHANDFLGGVCFVAYMNLALAYSKYSGWIIDTYAIAIVIMLTCGILWEYVFPLIYPRGVSDPLDIIAYISGGMTCIFIRKMTDRRGE